MFAVTNTIQVQASHAAKIGEQFAKRHTKESMESVAGFINFELLQRTSPENPEIIEFVVLSRWESKEDQKNWVKSNSFKQMHKKPQGTSSEEPKEKPKSSGVISNKISEYDVVV